MIKFVIKICVVMTLLAITNAPMAQIYKWVDEKGKVHYSSKPPVNKNNATTNQQKQLKRLDLKPRNFSPRNQGSRRLNSNIGTAGSSQLIEAAKTDDSRALALLDSQKVSVRFLDMAFAIQNHKNRLLKAMLSKISSKTTAPEYLKLQGDKSLLDLAAIGGNAEAIKLLMKKDSSRFQQNNMSVIALVNAIQAKKSIIVNTLIAFGVDVNAADSIAMKKSAEAGNMEIAKILLRNSASVNTKNARKASNLGRVKNVSLSPLALAVKNGHFDMVKLLVENGANVNASNRSYGTALDLAKKRSNDPIIRYLSLRGAKTSKENRRSRSAF